MPPAPRRAAPVGARPAASLPWGTPVVLSDREIVARVAREGMIDPFVDHQVGGGVVSYGLSSYGYDFRVAGEFKVARAASATSGAVDPKRVDARDFDDIVTDDACIIPPHGYALARTVEYFRIPRDVVVVCLGKSTYARCGIILNITPLEPEWEGHVTIAIANTGPLPARVHAGEGIGQALFLRAADTCAVSYKDRKGRYDRQTGIALPRVG
jgi:dCTP deaminase